MSNEPDRKQELLNELFNMLECSYFCSYLEARIEGEPHFKKMEDTKKAIDLIMDLMKEYENESQEQQ